MAIESTSLCLVRVDEGSKAANTLESDWPKMCEVVSHLPELSEHAPVTFSDPQCPIRRDVGHERAQLELINWYWLATGDFEDRG